MKSSKILGYRMQMRCWQLSVSPESGRGWMLTRRGLGCGRSWLNSCEGVVDLEFALYIFE